MMDGFLLINKEDNISSNKIDNIIKRTLGISKVGHLGTLDPLAKGLLVVMIGTSTKYAKYFDDLTKSYILEVRLGATSKSLDYETELEKKVDCDYRGKEDLIDDIINNYPRVYNQTPPIYSAIKTSGKKYYEMANKNIAFEPKKRDVTIYDIKRISNITYEDNNSFFMLTCHVSKGFYVRSLAREIGEKLNIPSMASLIIREKVGDFNLKDAYTMSDIENNNLELLNPLDYLSFNSITLDDDMIFKVLNGAKLSPKFFSGDEYYIIKNKSGENIAIYKRSDSCYRMDLLIKR